MNLAESRHGGDIFGFADEEQENVCLLYTSRCV